MKKKYFAIALTMVLGLSEAVAQTWQAVGDATGVSAGNAGRMNLISDYQGNLILGYYDVTVQKGNVQKFSNGAWAYPGGSSAGVTAGFAVYNSLAADSQGSIYFTNADSGMPVKQFTNGAWTQLPNATTNIINYQASAVSAGNVLFVASNDGSGTVKRYVNGAWEQVGNSGFFGGVPYYIDMAISGDGVVYISFNNNGYIHVYKNTVGASVTDQWQAVGDVNLAAASSSENYNSGIAVDGSNNLYLAYTSNGAGGNKLNVKKFSNGAWTQLGNENFTNYRVQHVSIAASNDGHVYVGTSIWEDATFLKNLVLAYDENLNAWSQLGEGYLCEGQATYNSLAVDAAGDIYIAYTDNGLGKISVKKFAQPASIPVQSVTATVLNFEPPAISTNNGTLQLVAAILPNNAANTDVTWAITSGSTFAAIDANGLVTALENGTITVTVTTVDGNHTDTIEIVITGQIVAATGVEISVANDAPATITTNAGTLQLEANVLPAGATNSAVTWAITSGSTFATIDANGLITGLENGTITVTVTTADGSFTDTIEIVISGQAVAATGVEISVANDAPATITTNTGTLQLEANVLPADATNSDVTWAITAGNDFATIDENGLVTAFANGIFTVTVTTADGSFTDTIEIVISGQTIAVTALTVAVQNDAEPTIITEAGTLQLVATVTPENATNTAVVWSITSGAEYASVSQDGVVTAIANGEVTVRATAADGTVYDEITVVVDIPVNSTDIVNNNAFSIYPNPTAGVVNIKSALPVTSVRLYDNLGREVFNTTTQSVDMAQLSAGIYILNATFDNGSSKSIKVIKK